MRFLVQFPQMNVFVFPGQGSASNDMHHIFSVVKEVFFTAEEVLQYNPTHLTKDQLKETKYSQIDILTKSIAIAKFFANKDILPTVVAGHSLGQYSALVACGAISFETCLKLVQRRGELMDECVQKNPGAMVACIAPDVESKVKEIIHNFKDLYCANYNSSNQLVLSGSKDAVDKFVQESQIKCIKLPVAGAFHSPLMASANAEMNEIIDATDFADTKIGFISNKTGIVVNKGNDIKADLVDQIISPVLWTQTMNRIKDDYASDRIYESGPGNVLSKLINSYTGLTVGTVS
jgi:[acyl-carrier-protein] S-malonyltransferase